MTHTSVLEAFLELERADPTAPVVMEKRLGLWGKRTRAELVDRIAEVAEALSVVPVRADDTVLLWVADHADWLVLDLAIQAVGASVCPLPVTATRAQLRHAFMVTGARVVVVDGQEQADDVLDLIDEGAVAVDHVLDVDPGGLHGHQDARLVALSTTLTDAGREHRQDLARRVASLDAARVAVRALTAGVHGAPRAVDVTHGVLVAGARAVTAATGLGPHDRVLSFRPLADPADRTTTIASSLLSGALLVLPESRNQVGDAMYEVAPTYVHLTRRWIDWTTSRVLHRLEATSGVKGLFARRWARHVARGDSAGPGSGLAVRYPVLEKLGLDRARLLVVSGDRLGAQERAFIAALGLPVRQAYALAEAGGLVTLADDDTAGVGRPLDHVEVRRDPSGEVLVDVTGPAHAVVATGDRGELVDGDLVLQGRIEDRVRISGEDVDVHVVQARLRDSGYVREAVVAVVDSRTVVVVELAEGPVERWASRQGIAFATFRALSTTDEVHQLLRAELEPLAAEAGIRRIDEIRVVPTPLEQVEGALTPAGRVRRDRLMARRTPGGSPVDAGIA